MNKILSTEKATQTAKKLASQGKTIVLAGGCFDILHVGHLALLNEAKKQADVLFVLLESDESIKKLKGKNRPINTQEDRAKILESLEMVDCVIKLPNFENNKDYDKLVISIKPAIIATSVGDPSRFHKERQASITGAKVVEVTEQIVNQSTTRLIDILNEL